MAQNYYHCFVAGLPDILLDETEVNFSMHDFKNTLEEELYPEDYELAQLLFLPYDNQNLLLFLQEKYDQFSELGNYTVSDFESELTEGGDLFSLPDYMYEFVEQYREDRNSRTLKQWENHLTRMFYDYVFSFRDQFLTDWFTFEMNVTNVLIGLNCREFDKDPEEELIGDNFVTEAVNKSSAKDFGLAPILDYVGQVIGIAEKDNLLAREKSLDQFRWDQLDEFTRFHYFSLEVILAYTIKLQMVYRWMELDEQTGRELFKQLIEELKESFEFSKEFMINE
ncbi:MAG: DUF2764 family protein [Bacteroidales bacterium]|nr:DUF2764 family protein [Bacteroidales bacterium]MBS3775148.1 DUF2764 family protein [Bacteroidales bacterium]